VNASKPLSFLVGLGSVIRSPPGLRKASPGPLPGSGGSGRLGSSGNAWTSDRYFFIGQAACNWKQFKGRAKEKWGRLTDDDLDVIDGRREQLEGKIQERYGLAKDQAKKDVEAWFNSLP